MAPKKRQLPGVDEKLQKLLDANMDEAPARRRAREAFKEIQLGIDHILFKTPTDGLKMDESYEVNSRGLEIFSKSWLPATSCPKAIVKLASNGYGVFAMDYPGFGLSEGLHCHIPSFDRLVDDVIEHYSKVKGPALRECRWRTPPGPNFERPLSQPEFRTLPTFLFGQSLGGAVALKAHLKQPSAWNGAILVAPMCKIADDMVPPWLLTQILIGVAKFLPKQKLVPQKNLAEAAFRDLKKREMTAYNVIAYKDKPRLETALEMLRTTEEIEHQLEEVSLPLLILHGEADIVTDPAVSKALHEKASSSDKKLILYMDAYHSLLEAIFKNLERDISPFLRIDPIPIGYCDDANMFDACVKLSFGVSVNLELNGGMDVDYGKKTIRHWSNDTSAQSFTFTLRGYNTEVLGQQVVTVESHMHKDWSFVGGLASSQIASRVFTLGTTAVLPFYALMVLAPKAQLTKVFTESSIPYVLLGVLYAYLLYLSWTPETLQLIFGSKYWLPELTGIAKMFTNEITLASAWIHLLVVDLFAARQVFSDGLQNQIETRHSVSLCLFFCPIGILTHVITKALTKSDGSLSSHSIH
ncbi:unnamed protein product [Malus baccata var. baccata]